ncbi:MAG: response regulator [Cyanobacteria bacterium SID2]|nr:response regulator [Cyanobacteria bacterium SID2]MBP0005450.1 response regulator [Cyanobacteria bacterium SBC]
MIGHLPGIESLARAFVRIHQDQKTGKLVLSRGNEPWHYYFLDGRLLYAFGGQHRVRRWNRALKWHCPHWRIDFNAIEPTSLWEYQLLHRAVKRNELSLPQAKSIIAAVTREVLFGTIDASEIEGQWASIARPNAQSGSFPLSIPYDEFNSLLQETVELWQQWQGMGLGYISPDEAPRWKVEAPHSSQLSPSSLSVQELSNGQKTLWDIAQKRKQSLAYLTRTLHYFIQQGAIELKEVPDMASPFEQVRLAVNAVKPASTTIACIDDSPTVSACLKQILEPQGYRVLTIQNPLKDMAILLSEQPELIFLDLMMPVVHGCDFCAFLRKTSVFQATPIVILTSSDGAIDRVRANLSGASDFLSKPPHPQKVLAVVRKHLDRSRQFALTSVAMYDSDSPDIDSSADDTERVRSKSK